MRLLRLLKKHFLFRKDEAGKNGNIIPDQGARLWTGSLDQFVDTAPAGLVGKGARFKLFEQGSMRRLFRI